MCRLRFAIPSRLLWWRCRRLDRPKLPPLHPVNPTESFCAQKPGLVLPAEGAPLMFASQLAHSLTLHIETNGGPNPGTADLPVTAEASLGGFVLEQPAAVLPEGDLTGTLRGKWGFDNWEGPRFHLRSFRSSQVDPGGWRPIGSGRGSRRHVAPGVGKLSVRRTG